jgi:hypothetical protein
LCLRVRVRRLWTHMTDSTITPHGNRIWKEKYDPDKAGKK